MLIKKHHKILFDVLSLPAAPFAEDHVRDERQEPAPVEGEGDGPDGWFGGTYAELFVGYSF